MNIFLRKLAIGAGFGVFGIGSMCVYRQYVPVEYYIEIMSEGGKNRGHVLLYQYTPFRLETITESVNRLPGIKEAVGNSFQITKISKIT